MNKINFCKRLFIASFLSDDEKTCIDALRQSNKNLIASHKPNVRFVTPEKWHLTWMFLGDCKKKLELEILKIIEETAQSCASQQMVYDRFAIWPSDQKPRVGVLESSMPPFEFISSVEQMQKRLAPLLENPGEQHAKFKPHITIARFKNKCFTQNEFDTNKLPLIHSINEVALVMSDMKTYEVIEKFSLRQE